MRRAFITGTAGFIGFHLARLLLDKGWQVHGFDGMTTYYDLNLKRARLALLAQNPNFTQTEAMLEDADAVMTAARAARPDAIIHLAAQAGVRYALDHPLATLQQAGRALGLSAEGRTVSEWLAAAIAGWQAQLAHWPLR